MFSDFFFPMPDLERVFGKPSLVHSNWKFRPIFDFGRFHGPNLFSSMIRLKVLVPNYTIRKDGTHMPNHGASDGATLIFAMNHGGEAAAEVGAREYG